MQIKWYLICSVILLLFAFMFLINNPNLTDINWKTFIVASVIMAITPGANQILSLKNGYNRGVNIAIKAVTGRFSAFLLMVIAVAFGLGSLLTASSTFFQIIKWIGAIYLIYLGIRMIRKSEFPTNDNQEVETVNRAIKQEFIVAMSNPKAYILFAVFLPQFISTQANNIPTLIIITGLTYIFVEFLCATIYACVGRLISFIKVTFNKDKLMNQLSGLTMVGLGVWLAMERPPK